jgi:hypothetical protein
MVILLWRQPQKGHARGHGKGRGACVSGAVWQSCVMRAANTVATMARGSGAALRCPLTAVRPPLTVVTNAAREGRAGVRGVGRPQAGRVAIVLLLSAPALNIRVLACRTPTMWGQIPAKDMRALWEGAPPRRQWHYSSVLQHRAAHLDAFQLVQRQHPSATALHALALVSPASAAASRSCQR